MPSMEATAAQILLEALEQCDEAARTAFVEQACAGDPILHNRVVTLLRAHGQPNRLLDGECLATAIEQISSEAPGTMIGPYKLREVIGEGGMGIVYVAEQERPIRRKVALKVIKPGMDTREVIARFAAERQALALMDHPNIAKVLDAGTTGEARSAERGARNQETDDSSSFVPRSAFRVPRSPEGRPYFVMELVRGLAITDYCDQRCLPPRERLKLFITVCQAVQHAHQRGIIHRDLKPSNVMITLHDGTPVPKVIDFGVAKALNQKLTEHTLYTRHSQMVGTPLYMSPEQAELSGLDVDARSDVYSLGVVLYELLTGTTPFEKERFAKAGFDEIRRIIREDEPPRPSQRVSTLAAEKLSTVSKQRGHAERPLAHALHGELDWIVMKALEKDRTRRYGGADALAADLVRFLDDQPVEACPPSLGYRLRKHVRRKSRAVGMTTLLLVLAALAICGPLAVYAVFVMIRGPERVMIHDPAFTASRPQAAGSGPIARAPGRELPGLIPEPLFVPAVGRWQFITMKPRGVMRSAVWNPQEARIALAESNHVRIYDASSMQLRHVLVAHSGPVTSVAWHPDGARLASASEDGTVRLWSSEGIPTHRLTGHSGPVYQVAWRPDGERLASASADGTVRLWSSDGRSVGVLDEMGRYVFAIDWSPDGRLLASAGGDLGPDGPDGHAVDSSVRVWDPETGQVIRTFRGPDNYSALCVDWRRDGSQLAVGYGDRFYHGRQGYRASNPAHDAGIRIWNLDGTPGPRLADASPKGFGMIQAVAWDPAGERLAFGGYLSTVHLWNPVDQSLVDAQSGNRADLQSIVWNRDGSRFLSTSRESLCEWDAGRRTAAMLLEGLAEHHIAHEVHWSPDGTLVSGDTSDGKIFWDLQGNPAAAPARPPGVNPAWWDAVNPGRRPDGAAAPSLEGGAPNMRDWAWGPNGWLAGAVRDGAIRIWNTEGRLVADRPGHRGATNGVSWSPDGAWLVSCGGDSVRIWQRDGTPGLVLAVRANEFFTVRWSPDGQWIAAAGIDSMIHLWRPDGTPGPPLRGHQGGLADIAWSPDSKRIVSGSWIDSTLRVWNVDTGKTDWQSLLLGADAPVTLYPAGHLRAGRDPLEPVALYVVEKPDGSMELLTVGDFRRRCGPVFFRIFADHLTKAAARMDLRTAQSASADALTYGSCSTGREKAAIAQAMFSVADREFHNDKYAEALPWLDLVIQWSPDDSKALDHRGHVLLSRGENERALADFDRAIQHGAEYGAMTYWGRALAHCRKANYPAALADMAQAVRQQPSAFNAIPPEELAASRDDSFREGLLALADENVKRTNGSPASASAAQRYGWRWATRPQRGATWVPAW